MKKFLFFCAFLTGIAACETTQVSSSTSSTTTLPYFSTNVVWMTNDFQITNGNVYRESTYTNYSVPKVVSNVKIFLEISNFLSNSFVLSGVTNTEKETNFSENLSGMTNLLSYMVLVTNSSGYNFYCSAFELTYYEIDDYCFQVSSSYPQDIYARMNYPAGGLNFWEVSAYCNWLSLEFGLPVAYATNGGTNTSEYLDTSGTLTTNLSEVMGFRILTLEEWQFAAKGGELSSGFTYSGGNLLNLVSWNKYNSGLVPHPVGGLSPNELGIYDMSGNTWEIVQVGNTLRRMGGSYKNTDNTSSGSHNPDFISSMRPALDERCTGKTFRIGFTE